ncbi:hypothetical protein GBAR_LOCUS11961 [Geodia barretti]|uniref:Uncharacterized protein n=2 Tax=Geodia barretti TaxID=519541 RepID=A0AA35RY96_GEOBA|nr:hypothetical protein GBAR_LOCUS11961 [Geodia barretti]
MKKGEKSEAAGDQQEVGRKEKCNEAEEREDREDAPSNVDVMDVGAGPTTLLDTEGNGEEGTAGAPGNTARTTTASTCETREATVEVDKTSSEAPVPPGLDTAILQGESATVAEEASSRSQPESGTDKPVESSENMAKTASTPPTTLDNRGASSDESSAEGNKKPTTATISQPAIEPEMEEEMQPSERESDTRGKPEKVDEEKLVTALAEEVKETPKKADLDVKTIDSHVECETVEIEQGSEVEMPETDVTACSPDLVKIISPKASFLPPSLSPNPTTPHLPLSSLTRTRRNTKRLQRVEQFDIMTPVVLDLREAITTDTKVSCKKLAAEKKSSKSMKSSSHTGDDLARRPKVVATIEEMRVSVSQLPKSRKRQKERSDQKDSENADIETTASPGSSGLLMQRKRGQKKKKKQQLESSGNEDKEGVGPHSASINTASDVGTPTAKKVKKVHFSNADTLSTDKVIKRKPSADVGELKMKRKKRRKRKN